MSRGVRLEKKGMLYHIICRGQRKEPLFFSIDDMNKYCQIVDYCLTQYDVEILAYCLMRNHIHLLVKRGTLPIADFMHRISTIYALYFNRKYSLAGHVFQGRYKAFPVLKEKYYFSVINYIHDNPERAGLVNKQDEYAYSSAHLYHHVRHKSEKISITHYSGKKRIYKNIEDKYNFQDGYIGTEREYREMDKRYSKSNRKHFPDRRIKMEVPIDKIFKDLCKSRYVIPDDIMKKWNRNILKKRNSIIYDLYMLGFSQTAIGDFFQLSRKTINKILKRLQK